MDAEHGALSELKMIDTKTLIDVDALRDSSQVTVDDGHDWGYQLRLVNEAEYCGKLLVLTNGDPGSKHYHKLKKETFIVLSGAVNIRGRGSFQRLDPGEQVTFERGEWHQMWVQETPAAILEVSTHDADSDTYRVD